MLAPFWSKYSLSFRNAGSDVKDPRPSILWDVEIKIPIFEQKSDREETCDSYVGI